MALAIAKPFRRSAAKMLTRDGAASDRGEASDRRSPSHLSPAERSRRYRQGLRYRKNEALIEVDASKVNRLVKRGYLQPSERDGLSAIQQAFNVFVWDTLRTIQPRASGKAVT